MKDIHEALKKVVNFAILSSCENVSDGITTGTLFSELANHEAANEQEDEDFRNLVIIFHSLPGIAEKLVSYTLKTFPKKERK